MSYTWDFTGFGVVFSTALFSQLFQHSVPGLIRPLPPADRPNVNGIFGAALGTTCFLYLLLGITAAVYFGKDTSSSINLNVRGQGASGASARAEASAREKRA
jgi:hypothetical protein